LMSQSPALRSPFASCIGLADSAHARQYHLQSAKSSSSGHVATTTRSQAFKKKPTRPPVDRKTSIHWALLILINCRERRPFAVVADAPPSEIHQADRGSRYLALRGAGTREGGDPVQGQKIRTRGGRFLPVFGRKESPRLFPLAPPFRSLLTREGVADLCRTSSLLEIQRPVRPVPSAVGLCLVSKTFFGSNSGCQGRSFRLTHPLRQKKQAEKFLRRAGGQSQRQHGQSLLRPAAAGDAEPGLRGESQSRERGESRRRQWRQR